jgi:hypothetical protein
MILFAWQMHSAETKTMKSFTKWLVAVWVGVGLLTVATKADSPSKPNENQTFRFNFEAGHPLVYSVSKTSKTMMDRSIRLPAGDRSSLTKKTVVTRYKMKLTPLQKSKDGIWTVHYQPFDFEEDVDFFSDNGHVVTSLRGLEVKATQNGIVTIDTAKTIGIAQAKSFKQAIYPMMLSGYLDFNSAGVVTKVDGDLPFVDYWTDALKLQIGFFDIVLPKNPLPPGGTWNESLTVKNLEGFQLGDSGIIETNEFVRDNDLASSSNQLVSFSVTMAMNTGNITGSIEQMGQNSMLNISEFNHNRSGKFQFDTMRNCLVNDQEEETGQISMDLLIQGHTASITLNLQENTKFELLPDHP